MKIDPSLAKEYGNGAFITGADLVNLPTEIISISPAIDIITGGCPSGANILLSGDPNSGKTLTALHFAANCQAAGRPVYFFNIEGRIRRRDLEGIQGLDMEALTIIRSYKDSDNISHILTAEQFLGIAEKIMDTVPKAVLVFDSVSMLATEKEILGDLEDAHRAPGPVLMAKFLKRKSNVISVNELITVSIVHLIANVSGYGKSKVKSGGRKIQYSADIDIEVKNFKRFLGDDGKVAGQYVTWITHTTASLAPGNEIQSTIRFGIGIDETVELVELACSIGHIKKPNAKSGWMLLAYLESHVTDWSEKKYRFNGMANVRKFMSDNPEYFQILKDNIQDVLAP